MGKVSMDSESSTKHFSHEHPMQLLNHQTHVSCSGCNLQTSESVYGCTPCNYFLHKKCSEMPKQITHPFDEHVLTLLPKPKYPEGLFNCDGCGKQGKGFSYHCEKCGHDLHILCASSPSLFTHQSHPHRLSLTFSPPYSNKSFHCHLCNNPGSNHWLYRCNSCAFDVHLSCVSKNSGTPTMTHSIGQAQAAQVMGMPFSTRPQMMNPIAYGTSSSGIGFGQNQGLSQQYAMQQAMAQKQAIMQQQAIMQAHQQRQAMMQQQAVMQQQAMMQQQAVIQQQAMMQQQVMMQQQGLGVQFQQQQPGNMLMNSLVQGLAGGVAQGATDAMIQGMFGGGGNGGGNGGNAIGDGGMTYMDFGGNDGSAYYDGGGDGGGGGDGSY